MISSQHQVTGNIGAMEVQLFQASHQGHVGPFVVGQGGHGERDQCSEGWLKLVEGRMAAERCAESDASCVSE